MRKHPTLLLALFLATPALAGDPPPWRRSSDLFSGLTVTRTYDRVKVTHYSATPDGERPCPLEDGIGGADESSSGFKPLSHRIDKPGLIYGRPTTLAALPQRGGTAGAKRCYFALPDAYPGKLFFGGDVYGPDSNNLLKTDISSPCTSIVNVTKYSKMVVYDCGRQAKLVGPLWKKAASAQPPKPAPAPLARPPVTAPPASPPGEEPTCPFFVVASCDKDRESLERSDSGLSDFQIIATDSVPGFSKGWFCRVMPFNNRDSAAAKLREVKSRAKSAYVKKGC